MKIRHAALMCGTLLMAGQAAADPVREVQYGPPPPWVLSAPIVDADAKPTDAALQIVYQDAEQRADHGSLQAYTAYRVKILKPEALALGNIKVAWSPSAGTATVHYVRIVRDGATIDVLKQVKLKVIEREAGLEQSMLDGNLTATLQVPDLRVGDELEFAATILTKERAFGSHNAGAALIQSAGLPGAFRYRLQWPAGTAMKTQLTNDLPEAPPKAEGGFRTIVIALKDPPSIPDIDGAPARYNIHRAIEFSDYAGWPDLSKQLWPLYDQASRLDPGSSLHAEVGRIAAASKDPLERMEAALRLVQDQVRYVFVGLDGGNYEPASADETWKRRFGDCKGKTVLLLALLRELGVQAQPVLVNSKGGDGTNERLPDPELFDHVLVQTSVAGKIYWLDGTRLGDRHLDMIPAPEFEWGLPLTAAGSQLISIPPVTSRYPETISVVDIDATGGFAKDAVWTVKTILHGDAALSIDTSLASVSPADADRAVKSYFHQEFSDISPDQVGWHYDERHAAIILSMKGTGKVDWDGDARDGHHLTLPGGGFYAPDKMVRPKDQDQSAAWAVTYPKFRCYATTVHLPAPSPGLHWTYSSKPVNRRLAGIVYWRQAGIQKNVVRTVMSSQSFTRELSASEAAQTNAQLPTFDNYMSSVEETASASADSAKATVLPFADEPDWATNPTVCSPAK